jgi:hypothetical protein
MIGGWKITAWLTQREKVIGECEAVLTTAYFDGLSRQDFVEGFDDLGGVMSKLGSAIAHEIGRNAIPFESFDHLYGDDEDNVTACLHVNNVETQYENQQLGYARTLVLGLGEGIRNLNEFDVVTQSENGWQLDDPVTYNSVIKTFHKSLVNEVGANFVAMTTISDPVSMMMRRHMNSGKSCHGAALSEIINEGLVIKDKIMKTCRLAAKKGSSPLGEAWIHYPDWESKEDYTTPAGEMA